MLLHAKAAFTYRANQEHTEQTTTAEYVFVINESERTEAYVRAAEAMPELC